MSKRLPKIILALSCIYLSQQLPASSEPTGRDSTASLAASAPEAGLVLQGGVKHKEFLDPVAPGLMSGAKFDEQAFSKLSSANNWIPIPSWLAGTWQFKTENVVDMVNYTSQEYTKPPYTIRNEAQKTFGQQKDKTGQIWHYLKAPYSYVSKLNHGVLGYERITSNDAIAYNESPVVLKIVGTDTQVSKANVVVETDQSEDINSYTPLAKESLALHGSAKHFDMNGRPVMDMTSNMIAKLAKPFEVVDQQDGDNLKQLFADYLTAHGKADLIP
jgi:hypothetical protein